MSSVQDRPPIDSVLAGVGPRLKSARARRDMTLAQLAAATGISKSTLSRLETSQRKPSLELLLPIHLLPHAGADTCKSASGTRRPAAWSGSHTGPAGRP